MKQNFFSAKAVYGSMLPAHHLPSFC